MVMRGNAEGWVTVSCIRCAKHERKEMVVTADGKVSVHAWRCSRGFLCDYCAINFAPGEERGWVCMPEVLAEPWSPYR